MPVPNCINSIKEQWRRVAASAAPKTGKPPFFPAVEKEDTFPIYYRRMLQHFLVKFDKKEFVRANVDRLQKIIAEEDFAKLSKEDNLPFWVAFQLYFSDYGGNFIEGDISHAQEFIDNIVLAWEKYDHDFRRSIMGWRERLQRWWRRKREGWKRWHEQRKQRALERKQQRQREKELRRLLKENQSKLERKLQQQAEQEHRLQEILAGTQNDNPTTDADAGASVDFRLFTGCFITLLILVLTGLGIMGIVQELQYSPYRLFWHRTLPASASNERQVQGERDVSSQGGRQDTGKRQNSAMVQNEATTKKPDSTTVAKPAKAEGKLSYEEELRLNEMKNVCDNNLHFLGGSVMLYSLSHDGNFPPQRGWITALSSYMEGAEGRDVTHCPAGGSYKYCARQDYKAGGARMIVYCTEHKVAFCEDGETRKLKRLP